MAFPFLALIGTLGGLFLSFSQQKQQKKMFSQQVSAENEVRSAQKAETAKQKKAAEGLTILPVGRQVSRFPSGLGFI